MPAQALVTGATGFIGRHLVRRLLEEGADVRVFCRSAEKALRLFGDSIELRTGDLLDSSRVAAACRGVGSIFHVGGAYCFGPANRRRLMSANVEGTRNLLEAAWQARVEKVVHVSTAGLLESPELFANEEDFPAHPFRFRHYKLSKWRAEQIAMSYAHRGLPVTVASPTCPIGPGDAQPTPTGAMILDFLQGRFPFVSKTGLNFVSVGDVADGLLAVHHSGRIGQRYILGGKNLLLRDFLTLVGRQSGRQVTRAVLPWPLIAAAGIAGEIAGQFAPRAGSRICWESAYYARKVHFFSLEKARLELGWKPATPLVQAVRSAVEWFSPNTPAAEPAESEKIPLTDALVH